MVPMPDTGPIENLDVPIDLAVVADDRDLQPLVDLAVAT